MVSVTGNVTTTRSVALGFENGGTVAAVYYNEGDHVNAGDVIAQLDTQNLKAQLAQAQANVDAETATLKNLQAGATPQNIAVSQTALARRNKPRQTPMRASRTRSRAPMRARTTPSATSSPRFSRMPRQNNPQLIFAVNNSQIATDIYGGTAAGEQAI